MFRKLTALVMLGGLLFSVGCSDDAEENINVDAESFSRGIIPQAQLDALDAAEGVGDILMQADEARRKQMEEAGI